MKFENAIKPNTPVTYGKYFKRNEKTMAIEKDMEAIDANLQNLAILMC